MLPLRYLSCFLIHRVTHFINNIQDGIVYIWDQDTGEVLQKLKGHSGMVYNAAWNNKQSLFVSCSDDKTLKTWWYDENVSLEL